MQKIEAKDGLFLEAETKTSKKGTEYRVITIEFDDGEIESLICFNDDLKFEVDKLYEFVITEDDYGKKITGLQLANPDKEPVQKSIKSEVKSESKEEEKDQKQLYINLNGKTYVTQTGLLNEAYKKGIKSIETEMLEFKDQEIAIVKSKVIMKDGSVFTGYGDATKSNTNSMMLKALLRLAETRATNRALRLATNIGMTSIEELGE